MKHNPIVSHQPENGSLRITYYPSNNLIIPLIEKDIMILSFSIFFIITFKEYFEYTKLL